MTASKGIQIYPFVFGKAGTIKTYSLLEMQEKMRAVFGWNCDYDAIGDKTAFQCRMATIVAPGITINNTNSTSVLSDVESTRPSIFVPTFGPKIITKINGSVTSSDPESHALYCPSGRRLAKQGIRSAIIFDINEQRLRRTLEVMSSGQNIPDLSQHHLLPLNSGPTNFVQVISNLCRILEQINENALTVEMIAIDETFYRVIATMFMIGASSPKPFVVQSLKTSIVDKACQFAFDHLEARITLTDLEAICNTSPRTLQYEFLKKFGLSPMAWLRRERLNRARFYLSKPTESTNVTAVAISLGFSNLGTFSRYYREEFGELPSETLMRSVMR